MSSSDRMLIPTCTCGRELQLSTSPATPCEDVTHIRVYRCHDCGHETRIIVWGADVR
jgi:DNA-directed RNA polymerase subunit RPC12/RpoP